MQIVRLRRGGRKQEHSRCAGSSIACKCEEGKNSASRSTLFKQTEGAYPQTAIEELVDSLVLESLKVQHYTSS